MPKQRTLLLSTLMLVTGLVTGCSGSTKGGNPADNMPDAGHSDPLDSGTANSCVPNTALSGTQEICNGVDDDGDCKIDELPDTINWVDVTSGGMREYFYTDLYQGTRYFVAASAAGKNLRLWWQNQWGDASTVPTSMLLGAYPQFSYGSDGTARYVNTEGSFVYRQYVNSNTTLGALTPQQLVHNETVYLYFSGFDMPNATTLVGYGDPAINPMVFPNLLSACTLTSTPNFWSNCVNYANSRIDLLTIESAATAGRLNNTPMKYNFIKALSATEVYAVSADRKLKRFDGNNTAAGWVDVVTDNNVLLRGKFHVVSSSEIYAVAADNKIYKWKSGQTAWIEHVNGYPEIDYVYRICDAEWYGIGNGVNGHAVKVLK